MSIPGRLSALVAAFSVICILELPGIASSEAQQAGAAETASSVALTGSPTPAADAARVAGLLVVEGDPRSPTRVAIITLTGRRLPVPAPVQSSPLGLSPDGRHLARLTGHPLTAYRTAVELGDVRTGRFTSLLDPRCRTSCPTEASFAWSPDSRSLAAAATPKRGPTILRIFDRRGRRKRSFSLPGIDPSQSSPAHQVREYHQLISWSPDGSRLLLLRSNEYLPFAIVALDIKTGSLHTLASFGHKDDPTSVEWSPNGRLLALASSEGFSERDYTFAVISVATGRAILKCTSAAPCKWGQFGSLAWDKDSRSLFTNVANKIDRIDLTGRRSTVLTRTGSGTVFASVNDKLIYDQAPRQKDALWLLSPKTRQRTRLYESRNYIVTVVPLHRIPTG